MRAVLVIFPIALTFFNIVINAASADINISGQIQDVSKTTVDMCVEKSLIAVPKKYVSGTNYKIGSMAKAYISPEVLKQKSRQCKSSN